MKRIISLVLLILCITAVCVPMYSCESTENTDKKGRQYICSDVVCSVMLSLSSVDPYLSYVLTESVLLSQKKEALYVTPNMHLFSTVRYEEDIQSVWKELGVLIEDSFDLKIINSDSDWKNGHSFQHITDNLECVYSINKDNNVKLQLIFLKDKTVYLSISSKSNESIFLLEETEISYYEDIQRPSFEVFTFSVSGTAEEYMVFKTNVLCFYNDRTEFFLQCAENNNGGIHGKVTETRDGYLLETYDGKYKLTVHTDSDSMHFTAESPEKINFGENITVGTGNDLKKAGEYYTILNQNSGCFDTWRADFNGDGIQEQITFHRIMNYNPRIFSSIEDLSVPTYRINAAVWENGEIKHFVFLPFENAISRIRFFEDENGELFAEADEIKYRRKQYSGVSLPSYWEPYTETVIYNVNVDENGLSFTKAE